jgi:DNA-binding CsgD family transcriptional regulator
MGRDLGRFAALLQEANDFVAIGRVVCDLSKVVFQLHQVVTMLLAPDGRPVLSIDNLLGHSFDALRLAYFDELWRHDPFVAALRARHVPLGADFLSDEDLMQTARNTGYKGDDVYTITLPILNLSKLIGMIRCGALEPFSLEHQRDLAAMASHVSVRLAQLGITPLLCEADIAQLTPRELEVARLAADGSTNAEIGSHMALSENTVKKYLKQVFVRLRLSNRAELAMRFARLGRRDSAPVGFSRVDGYTITKAASC